MNIWHYAAHTSPARHAHGLRKECTFQFGRNIFVAKIQIIADIDELLRKICATHKPD